MVFILEPWQVVAITLLVVVIFLAAFGWGHEVGRKGERRKQAEVERLVREREEQQS